MLFGRRGVQDELCLGEQDELCLGEKIRWIFDRFLIDFGSIWGAILGPKLVENGHQKGSKNGVNFRLDYGG